MPGEDYCPTHHPDPEKRQPFGGVRPGAGRPRNPKVTEIIRDAVEYAGEEILKIYFEPLGLDFQGWDDDGVPIVRKREGGGLKLVGISKDGDVNLSPYEDAMGKVKIAELLQDRVYGKPRQSMEVTGGTRRADVDTPKDNERAKEVAEILAEAMGIKPPQDAIDVPEADVVEVRSEDRSEMRTDAFEEMRSDAYESEGEEPGEASQK